MYKDSFSITRPELFLDAQPLVVETVEGLGVDVLGYRSALITVDLTSGALASVSFEQSSDDGGTDPWVAIPDSRTYYTADIFPVAGAVHFNVGVSPTKRWLRVILDSTAIGGVSNIVGILQNGITSPFQAASTVIDPADINNPGPVGDAQSTPPKIL